MVATRMLEQYNITQEAVENQYCKLIELDNKTIMGAQKMLLQKKMYKALNRLELAQQNIIQVKRFL